MNETFVLDASAVICFINEEPGYARVAQVLKRSVLNSVNLAEVVTKLTEAGMTDQEIARTFADTSIKFVDFKIEAGLRTGHLRRSTRHAGLSLGDRACLATAEELNATVVTSDRSWARIGEATSAKIELIR